MRWAAADIECWFDIYWTHCPLGDLTDCCSQSLAEHRRRLADSASLDQTTAKSRCGLFGRWHRALMLINYSLCNTGESQRRLLNEKPAYLNVSNISKKTSNSKHLYSSFRLLSGYCDQETWIMCKLREHQSCMTVKATVGDVNCKCLSLLPLTVFFERLIDTVIEIRKKLTHISQKVYTLTWSGICLFWKRVNAPKGRWKLFLNKVCCRKTLLSHDWSADHFSSRRIPRLISTFPPNKWPRRLFFWFLFLLFFFLRYNIIMINFI